MYLPRDLGDVISARYVLADRAAVLQPKPVMKRPPRIMENDREFAEMMAPTLDYQLEACVMSPSTYMSTVLP